MGFFSTLEIYEMWSFLNGKILSHIFARKIKFCSCVIAGHPVCACVHARLGAQCRDSFAFLILRALARAHTRTPPILPHTCDLLPTASSSTCSHSSWFSSYCGVSLPAAGTRTHPMSGATDTDNRGSPLLCATLLIRVPRDVPAKLRSSRLERDFRFMRVAPTRYVIHYRRSIWKFTFTRIVHF